MTELNAFLTSYYQRFAETLLSFDKGPLADVLGVFDAVTAAGGTVWVAGNGGSAAIADHTVCDCSKGTYVEGQSPFAIVLGGLMTSHIDIGVRYALPCIPFARNCP